MNLGSGLTWQPPVYRMTSIHLKPCDISTLLYVHVVQFLSTVPVSTVCAVIIWIRSLQHPSSFSSHHQHLDVLHSLLESNLPNTKHCHLARFKLFHRYFWLTGDVRNRPFRSMWRQSLSYRNWATTDIRDVLKGVVLLWCLRRLIWSSWLEEELQTC